MERPRGEHGPEPEPLSRFALGTLGLLAMVAALLWAGLAGGHVRLDPGPAPEPAPAATATATMAGPTQIRAPTPSRHAAAFTELSTRLGGGYALAWVDGDGLHSLGTPVDQVAWSTIKVPLAISALEHGTPGGDALVERAVTASDNEAGMALWRALGPPEEAARSVDEVLAAYRSAGTRTQSEVTRQGFSPFGQTVWTVQDQARFASRLACAPSSSGAGAVRQAMGRVIAGHRWGLAPLEGAHVKGGWGPGADGGYVVRQFGDALVEGRRYALAVSARAEDGGYANGTSDLSELVQWWAATVAPGTGAISCR